MPLVKHGMRPANRLLALPMHVPTMFTQSTSQGSCRPGIPRRKGSLRLLALRYNPSKWLPAPAAGPYVLRMSAFVLLAGGLYPLSTRRR
jgi:hypothetical protein